MWFLWFYLISLGICIIIFKIIAKATANKIKREFPNIKAKKKKSFSELVSSFLPFAIPFINLVLIVFCIFQQDKIINETIERLRKEQVEQPNGEESK